MSNIDNLPYVEGELNYLGPMTERPRYYAYEIGERSNMTYDPHKMRIHDLRPISSDKTSIRRASRWSSIAAPFRISGTTTRCAASITRRRNASSSR